MERSLQAKPQLLGHLLPDFPPLCKRLTPGPGYLEPLTSPKVNVITTSIERIDETGVVTSCGTHRPVDAIVCATGFETNPGGGFPFIGKDGVNLRHKCSQRPETYLGLATDGFPNFFQSLGPSSFQGAGNLLIMMEQVHSYVAEVLSRMAFDKIGLVEPKRAQVDNFTRFCDRYFECTVYSAECASWYKSSPPGTAPYRRFWRHVYERYSTTMAQNLFNGVGLSLEHDIPIVYLFSLLSTCWLQQGHGRESTERLIFWLCEITQKLLEALNPPAIVVMQCVTNPNHGQRHLIFGRIQHPLAQALCSSIDQAREGKVDTYVLGGRKISIMRAFHRIYYGQDLEKRRHHSELLQDILSTTFYPYVQNLLGHSE